MARRALAVLLAAGLLGCPKDEKFDEHDRTIAQLKAEQERLAKGGTPSVAPKANEPTQADALAEAAAAPKPPEPLKVLESQGSFGGLTLTVKSAEVSRNVKGNKTAVSTPERFLKLVLSAKATSRDSLELGTLVLARQAQTATVARDVQRVAQGSPLGPISIEPGVEQELVVYFELAPELIAPGLVLQLKAADRTLVLPLL